MKKPTIKQMLDETKELETAIKTLEKLDFFVTFGTSYLPYHNKHMHCVRAEKELVGGGVIKIISNYHKTEIEAVEECLKIVRGNLK